LVHLDEFIGFNDLHDLKPVYFIRHFSAIKPHNLLETPINREKERQRHYQATQDYGIIKPGQGSDGDIVEISPDRL
jgi:hypothetical protein